MCSFAGLGFHGSWVHHLILSWPASHPKDVSRNNRKLCGKGVRRSEQVASTLPPRPQKEKKTLPDRTPNVPRTGLRVTTMRASDTRPDTLGCGACSGITTGTPFAPQIYTDLSKHVTQALRIDSPMSKHCCHGTFPHFSLQRSHRTAPRDGSVLIEYLLLPPRSALGACSTRPCRHASTPNQPPRPPTLQTQRSVGRV